MDKDLNLQWMALKVCTILLNGLRPLVILTCCNRDFAMISRSYAQWCIL